MINYMEGDLIRCSRASSGDSSPSKPRLLSVNRIRYKIMFGALAIDWLHNGIIFKSKDGDLYWIQVPMTYYTVCGYWDSLGCSYDGERIIYYQI